MSSWRVALTAAIVLAIAAPAARASTNVGSATVAPGGHASWTGSFYAAGANTNNQLANQTCSPEDPNSVPGVNQCDVFTINFNVPAGYWASHKGGFGISIKWDDPGNDFDMFVYKKPAPGHELGPPVASSAGVDDPEHLVLYSPEGTYLVRVNPFQVAASDYTGTVSPISLKPIPNVAGGVPQYRASHDVYTSHSEPHISVNPLNPENLVAGSKMYQNLDEYLFKIGTYSSLDGGRTWRDNGQLPGYPKQKGTEGNDYYITSDVWTTFDDEGNAYAMVLDSPNGVHGAGWGMTMHKSTDGGRHWSGRKPIEQKNDPVSKQVFLSDKNAITADNFGRNKDGKTGNLYACWSEDASAGSGEEGGGKEREGVPGEGGEGVGANVAVAVSRSTDAGDTWSGKTFVSGVDHTVIGCQVVVGPPTTPGQPGPLYVFWLNFSDVASSTGASMRMAKSTDGGQSFSSPVSIAEVNELPGTFPNSAFRNLSVPGAAVDPGSGTVYVTWADYHAKMAGEFCPPDPDAPPGQVCDGDILLTRSTNGGDSWRTPIRVNKDTPSNGKDQFQPAVAVTDGGQVDLSWFDRRKDPQNFYIDTFLSRSNDQARSWKETRVTKSMWDPSLNPPISGSGQFIGDYQGLAATDCYAHPFWNDTTLANLKPSDPRYSQYQEVFAARIPNTSPYGGRSSRLPSGCAKAGIPNVGTIGGRFLISRRAVKMTRSGVIKVRVSCRTPLGCRGTLRLRTARRVRIHGERRKITLGSKSFSYPTKHRKATIKVRLSRNKRRLVRRLRRFRVSAIADVRIGSDIHGTVTKKFRLHRDRRHR